MKSISTIFRGDQVAGIAWALLLLFVWVLPGLLLSANSYSLEYDYIQNVRVAASLDKDYLLPLDFSGFNFIPEHQGSELLRLILCKVSGLSIQELQFLPLGAILVPLTFYVLCREFLGSRVAALLSVSVAFDPTVVFTSYHTAIYAWSRPLLITFVFLYTRILKRKTPPLILLSILVFIGLFTLYWTGSALMISFSFLVNILVMISWRASEQRNTSAWRVLTLSNAVAFLVIYLGFGEFVYHLLPSVLGQEAGGKFGPAFFSLTQRLLQLIGLAPPEQVVDTTYSGASLHQTIQVFRYLLIIFPVIWVVTRGVRSVIVTRKMRLSFDVASLVLWSLVGVLLSHTFLYSSYGHASTRYIALLGPLVAAIALDKCRVTDRVELAFAAILGLLACVSFAIASPQTRDRASWAEIKPATVWFLENAGQEILVSNVGTFGMFAMESVPQAVPPTYVCYLPAEYASVIGVDDELGQLQEIRGYVVIDKQITSSEICPGFRYFDPLSSHLDQIDRNINLDPVYDNGGIRMLAPTKGTTR
jgi:hypothetical protein